MEKYVKKIYISQHAYAWNKIEILFTIGFIHFISHTKEYDNSSKGALLLL